MAQEHFVLPKIYPITHRGDGSANAVGRQAIRLIDAGARIVQIRDKHASSAELFETLRVVREAAKASGSLVVVNDRVDIALAGDARAVHLGQNDLPASVARRLLGPGSIIGLSTHSVKQALAAREEPIDYIAAGPIFPTKTKENPDPVLGLDGLAAIRRAVGDIPLVAIGGIDRTNIAEVFAAGADSAAVISALYERDEIEANCAALNSLVHS